MSPLGTDPRRADFAGNEQRCAPFLVSLAQLTNEIDDSLTDRRGFFAGRWWRTPSAPWNARTYELVYVLSWFAAHERRWNPYFRDPALIGRLGVSLDAYLALQSADGAWPEYSPKEASLAATAFGMGYLTKTLTNLRAIGAFPERQDEIVRSVRRGARWFLDPQNALWTLDRIELSNQVLAGFSSVAQSLRHDPDTELADWLADRIAFAVPRVQSPAGFMYESGGADAGYTLSVALGEITELHENLGSMPFLPHLRRLADWLALVMVPEPDGSGTVIFDSASTRTPMAFLDATTRDGDPRDLGARLAQHVPALASFFTAAEERQRERQAWAATSAPVAGVDRGTASPRVLANVTLPERLPDAASREAATARMPVVAEQRFTILRRDSDQDYLFVRRPSYYVQAFFGTRRSTLVQSGLGLLWHPGGGAFVHAGSDPKTSWSVDTKRGRREASRDLAARYTGTGDDARADSPEELATTTTLRVRWEPVGAATAADVLFEDRAITRKLTVASPATEQVPFLLRVDDIVSWADESPISLASGPVTATATGLTVRRGGVTLRVDWGRGLRATLRATDRWYFADRSRRTVVLRVQFSGRISFRYELSERPADRAAGRSTAPTSTRPTPRG